MEQLPHPLLPCEAYGEEGVAYLWQPAFPMPADKELKNSSTRLRGHGEPYAEILTLLALCRGKFPAEAARALEVIKAHRPSLAFVLTQTVATDPCFPHKLLGSHLL